MKLRSLIVLMVASIALAACQSFDVGSDFDSDFDFSSLNSYQWHQANEYNTRTKTYLNSDLLDKRIRTNVDASLQGSGFQQTDSNPDFWVNYTVSTEPRVDVNTYNTYSGFAPGWGYYGAGPYGYGGVGMGFSNSETRVDHYEEGTFVLDIVDPNTSKLVWRGTANGRIPKNLSQQEREEAVKEVVTKVLENFPPK